MVIRKIGILNVQLVKGSFATGKHDYLKLSTRKFIIFKLLSSKKQLTNRENFF